MAKLLITTTAGPDDPTGASIPFHIGANGAGASGVEYALVLAGDATELLKPEVAGAVRGVGVPPLQELMAKCSSQGIRVYV
jgi:predicted peroxiredoxin